MSNQVVIKSFKNGLSIYLPAEGSFEEIQEAVASKFKEASSFFKNAKMAIKFEGRELSDEEERALLQTIQEYSDVEVLCIIGQNEVTEKQFIKALTQVEQQIAAASNMAQVYRGSVINKKHIETPHTIIILGDVNPECVIRSDKDVIILGRLFGEVYAGLDGETGHYVCALEMAPEVVKINQFKYYSNEKTTWLKKAKVMPKVIYEENGILTCELISKETMEKLSAIC